MYKGIASSFKKIIAAFLMTLLMMTGVPTSVLSQAELRLGEHETRAGLRIWPGPPPTPTGITTQSQAIRAYLDSLPRLSLVQSMPGREQAMVGLPVGVTGTQLVGGTFVNDAAELAILKSFSDIHWAGALVQGSSIASNDFSPINLSRSGGRIRLATNFVGATAASQFKDLPVIRAGEVEDATRTMLMTLAPTDSVATTAFEAETAGTLREAMVKLGVAYKGVGSIDAHLNSTYSENTVVAKFTQVFYTVAFDPDPSIPSPFFASSVTLNDVKGFATPTNPPLFVSELKYGRILLIKFTANLNKLDLGAAVKAMYGSVSGSLDARLIENINKVRMDLITVGATGEHAGRMVTTSMGGETVETKIAALRDAITSASKYNPHSNPGAPIAFTMRYVGSLAGEGAHAVAIAQMVTTASPEVISLNATEICNGPFRVWDGPGGGWVDTGIDVNPGDKVRFHSSGVNWSGVFATGDYGPAGWHTWDAPGDGGRGYPIVDRSPFALIARFGNGNEMGADRTRWGYSAADGKPASDSFYIGVSAKATAGEVDKSTGRGTPGYGRVYLGTNDNNPLNGDANKRFDVTVCYTRKIY